jgi:hypothetical protein
MNKSTYTVIGISSNMRRSYVSHARANIHSRQYLVLLTILVETADE